MILKLYADSKNGGTCGSCGAPIVWAELTSGKRMPFNSPVAPSDAVQMGNGRVVELVDTSVSPSHFQTCPFAAEHRKPRAKQAR